MSVTPNYVPREYKTINVILIVKDAHRALQFYNDAFGAEIVMKLLDPSGKIKHAEIKIDDTIIMLAEGEECLDSGILIEIYTGDAERLFESAIRAGAVEVKPIELEFYGDRAGRVKDPFGHQWIIATHVEDVTAKDLQKRFNELNP